MRQFKEFAIALALGVGICPVVQGQYCVNETFDTDVSIVDTPSTIKWSTTNSSGNSSIPYFYWNGDGDASGGDFWGSRQRINSNSMGGAAVITLLGIQKPASGSISQFGSNCLYSPEFTEPNPLPQGPVFLTFQQYYRAFDFTRTTVEICKFSDCDTVWQEIYSNDYVSTGSETTNGELVVINLTPYIYTSDGNEWFFPFRLRFNYEGGYYFWIIDDIKICEENPYNETVPPELGDYLSGEHPYDTDPLGNPYVPDELIVEFKPDADSISKQHIRDSLGVDSFVVCQCNTQLELWIFNLKGDGIVDTLSVKGDTTTNLLELKPLAASKSRIHGDGVSYNYYTYRDFKDRTFPPQYPYIGDLGKVPDAVPPRDSDEIVFAHLDSGIDIFNPDLASHLRRNDGTGCYLKDSIGHDFVSGDNNVFDDNGHGTRTAILMTNQLPFLNCSYKLLPLKTHDHQGIGTLFNNTCAMYYAQREGANVALLSWGWRGEHNNILKRAIDSMGVLNNAIVVCAAGNEGLLLDTVEFYPASYIAPNLIRVGGVLKLSNTYVHSDSSNYSGNLINIGALGENVLIPGFTDTKFNGTSYAAPAVASAVASLQCLSGDSIPVILNQLYDCADKIIALEPYIIDGRVLVSDFPCQDPPALTGQLIYALTRNGTLISFDSRAPEFIRQVATITGITQGLTPSGMDFRPKTGELYILAYNQSSGVARLYTVDIGTGVASVVGSSSIILQPLMGKIGMDFDPVRDQVRITGSNNSNYRLDPVTGGLVATDKNLNFDAADPHSNSDPSIGALAYSNNFPGTPSTALYCYDDSLNVLIRQELPDSGKLITIGPSQIFVELSDQSADLDIYFDPVIRENIGFLAANIRSEIADNFYTIDLQTGAATLVGKIGSGIAIKDIAVKLKEEEKSCETKTVGCIKYEVLSISTDATQRKTYRIRVTNNCTDSLNYVAFGLPKGVYATQPENGTVYASPAGNNYSIRNASFSPFYSIRFQEQGTGITWGQADVFEYTLPAFTDQDYVYVLSRMKGSRAGYETYLSLSGCIIDQQSHNSDAEQRNDNSSSVPGKAGIFPNPTNGFIFADLSAWQGEQVRIQILNSQGQQVQRFKLLAGDVLLPIELPVNLPEGLYFFEIVTEKGTKQAYRFVLQY